MYNAGLKTIDSIYNADTAKFVRLLPGVKDKMAERIYNGLRVGQDKWNEVTFMVASNKFPKLVGATKLNLLLDLIPDPNDWTSEALIAKRASGISAETINGIVNSLDDYFEWYDENIRPIIGNKRLIPTNQEAPEERENRELQEERERHPAQPAYGGGQELPLHLQVSEINHWKTSSL